MEKTFKQLKENIEDTSIKTYELSFLETEFSQHQEFKIVILYI